MAVVTISRQFGAGGHTIGETVAKRLGYNLVDRGIIQDVAKAANVSVEWVESVEKEAGGALMRMLSGLVSSSFIERITGDSAYDFDERKFVVFLTRLVRDIADRDNAVIVGRGSQFILADHPRAVRVLLVAELEDRIQFMVNHYSLSRAKADQLVKKESRRRAAFLKNFSSADPDDPRLYSLALNTSRLSLEEAEDMIIRLVDQVERAANAA